MTLTMAELYKISATPLLHTTGDFKGKLKGVSFTAVSPSGAMEWFSSNCGQFELAFSKIMPINLARVMVAALMHGDDVELPGVYAKHEFEDGFVFEWPRVHLTLPPIYFPDEASA
jgi:hypothetical protein